MLKNATHDSAPAIDEKDANSGIDGGGQSPKAGGAGQELPSPEAPDQTSTSAAAKLTDATQDVTWRIVEHAVMKAFSVGVGDLNMGSRGAARAAHARQVAMYLAHVTCHHTYTEVGRMANRDRTTVAHACAVVEDGRDDPVFDQTLEHLERSVQLMAHRQLPSRN